MSAFNYDNSRPNTSNINHKRPKTASESGRFGNSLGKFIEGQGQTGLDEKTVSMIWKAFGSYIAKQLRNGKGVSVPKYGNFTFSATLGTTNPGERDKQFREPVFIVGKDFVSAVALRAGIAHNKGQQLRPHDIKGVSGIIPKVKINYTEVAVLCNQTKDICKNGCEQVFRFLSDKVRKGESVAMELPFVGTFVVRGGIAAFSFVDDLCEETKGVTAKSHFVNKLFASSVNQLNLKINDQNKFKENPTMGGAMRITGDAEQWLRNNLNISVPDLAIREPGRDNFRVQSAHPVKTLNRYGSVGPEDLRNKSWALNQNTNNNMGSGLTEHNKMAFDRISEHKTGPLTKRPMSAVTRVTSASRVSNVPDIGRMKLMLIANDIHKNRQLISDTHIQGRGQLRDLMSSSELQNLLKKVGIYLEVSYVKALLRDLGYQFNGKSCSLVQLFQSIQQLLYGSSQREDQNGYEFKQVQNQKEFQTEPQAQSRKQKTFREARIEDQMQLIKDLFYSTGKSLYEIYQEARLGSTIDFGGFMKVIQEYSNNSVDDSDINAVFQHVARGSDLISYQEFERAFKWQLPAGGEWETKCIRKIREWMFKNGYSSETAFEMFLKKVDRILQKKLTRVEFHRVMTSFDFRFTAPEIDGLFRLLDINQDGELDIEEWKSRIYEDSLNPLQMLREVISNNKITSDDLLFRMQFRIWDEPLGFPKLCEGLRRIDPTLSEPQLRHLAKTLKNKDNKVEITTLLRNLCGQEHETVDYRNKIFRKIYEEIHPHKEEQLKQLLEDADPINDGRVEPQALKAVLKKIVKSIDDDSIDRFIRFLDKDRSGKIVYMEFLGRMSEVSNRDHNPFKSVVQRLAYFIESNKQSISSILRRLMAKCSPSDLSSDQVAVSVSVFAEFLKTKIDKKRSHGELRQYANYIDIDKDGFISEIDLQTCLNNLNSNSFFKNGGEALAKSGFASQKKFYPTAEKLSEERACEVVKQIRDALIDKKIAYREAFNRFDQNQDGFLSLTEFSQGIDKVLTLSIPIKEKLFALMDSNEIGLVDYPNFIKIINLSSANKLNNKGVMNDTFDWEYDVIEQIKNWIKDSSITIEEGFKSFDKDFDGFINKNDLKWALTNILKIKEEEILPTKLDRLFRLIDFYKTGNIQLSDFQRLIRNENPYQTSGDRYSASSTNFRKSFGGSFAQTSTFDWKVSAIQQMGLVLSKKFGSIKESFEVASERFHKVTFEQFKKFIESNQALAGFNMTLPLIQKLFAEIDPHRKGYLTENDWVNAFQAFNYNDQIMIELKNLIQCSFSDCISAFDFFLTFKKDPKQKSIQFQDFEKAVQSLSAGRFKSNEIQQLWSQVSNNGYTNNIDQYQFRSVFDNVNYTGNSTVRNIKTAPPGARTTIVSQTSSSSTWDVDILEKIRQIIKSSAQTLDQIFRDFDSDGNGSISDIEFRQAIRKLNLGLTSREIDKLMLRIDTNQDGKIDYNEFMAKFKTNDLDVRLKERAKDKMARIKELMMLHMTSPNDAFRFFDESKLGKLTYQEFGKLVIKLYELAGEKPPAYPVIKDLFDTIDIRKDGILDINEWQQTFGHVVEGSNKLSIKATPLTQWENSREFMLIGQLIAKNRKLLKEEFERITKQATSIINFDQGKQILMTILKRNYSGIQDDKIKVVLKVGEVLGPNSDGIGNQYDYLRILDVYKSRHAGPQL